MQPLYACLREIALGIISRFPPVDFYHACDWAVQSSRDRYENDPVVAEVRSFVEENLEDDFGHGLAHAVKVTVDAGALLTIEGDRAGYNSAMLKRQVCLAQCSGLLHDIKRKQKNHAVAGADFVRMHAHHFSLSALEVDDICIAIRNHEAFKTTVEANNAAGQLVSDCLYDGDKFRWGPDNFKDTLWDMVSFYNPPLKQFLKGYPGGMQGLARIKHTFRTPTGQHYGPQFIETGIAIGRELLQQIQSEFGPALNDRV